MFIWTLIKDICDFLMDCEQREIDHQNKRFDNVKSKVEKKYTEINKKDNKDKNEDSIDHLDNMFK
jgi:hypothetical protein